MNPYIEKLKAYLDARSKDREDAEGVLKLLCYYYTVENSIDSTVIRSRFREMDSILRKLSLQDNDTIFRLTVELCEEYIEQAFLAGARTGARLVIELRQSP